MPNYNITIDSKFDPYSFEDYLKPAMLMQEQHNQAADAYANYLAQSAGLYDALRANEEDALAAKYVNDYENSLNALANDLATNGLNRSNRRGVYETKAKTGYIEKLKKAMDNRNTFIAQQNELINKDPSLVISDYAANHGITRFLNPDFQYRSYSKNALRQQAAKLFEELSKSTYLDPNNPEYKRIAGLTMEMGIKAGLKPEDIQSAIDDIREHGMNNKSSKTTQILGNIAQGILISNLGERENNPYWSKDQWDTAMSGLMDESWHALGTEDFKTVNIDEPRASGSSSSSKDDLLIDPTFVPVLTPNENKVRGIDSMQKDAISNSLSWLGGDDNISEEYSVDSFFKYKTPLNPNVSSDTFRDNVTEAIQSQSKWYDKTTNKYTKDGEKAIKALNKYINESRGMYLSEEKIKELEKLRKKALDNYNTANVGWGLSKNIDPKVSNGIDKLMKENEELANNNGSSFFVDYRSAFDDKDQTTANILSKMSRGEKISPNEYNYMKERRNKAIAEHKSKHPEDKIIEENNHLMIDVLNTAKDYYNRGSNTSDIIHLSRAADPKNMWRNIAADIKLDQLEPYQGKDSDGRFINNGSDYGDTSKYEDYFDDSGNLKDGAEIGYDIDSDGTPAYIIFDFSGKHAPVFGRAINRKSFDHSGTVNYKKSLDNKNAIEREYNKLVNSDEYKYAALEAEDRTNNGLGLTNYIRNILEREAQLRQILEIANRQAKYSGREGFTNFYKQASLNRTNYKEDVNKEVKYNYGTEGY